MGREYMQEYAVTNVIGLMSNEIQVSTSGGRGGRDKNDRVLGVKCPN